MFSLLVRRGGLIDPPPMSEVDAHCHILPGIDDGAENEEMSLAIAHLLLELGVRQVVATPHVISDTYSNSTERIYESVQRVQTLFDQRDVSLKVMAGAEYYAEKELLNRISNDDIIAWGEERYVLFESPMYQEPLLLNEIIFRLKSSGYTPLLAHAERYRYLQKNPARIDELRRLGVRFQVNHPSFHLPRTSRRGEMARLLYVKGLVDQFGTDIHHATSSDCLLASRGDSKIFTVLANR